MTPLHIDILLHYYTRPGDYRDGDFSAPAVKEYVGWLAGNDLISSAHCKVEKYEITDRGRALVDAICDTPLPINKWVVPARPWQ